MFRHILPNLLSPIIVAVTRSVGQRDPGGVNAELPRPRASSRRWRAGATCLTNAQETIWEAPMLAIWPGLFIFVTAMCFNFLGDGLQDAFDPRAEF